MQRKNWRDITEAEREQIVDEAYDLIDRLRTENITLRAECGAWRKLAPRYTATDEDEYKLRQLLAPAVSATNQLCPLGAEGEK